MHRYAPFAHAVMHNLYLADFMQRAYCLCHQAESTGRLVGRCFATKRFVRFDKLLLCNLLADSFSPGSQRPSSVFVGYRGCPKPPEAHVTGTKVVSTTDKISDVWHPI